MPANERDGDAAHEPQHPCGHFTGAAEAGDGTGWPARPAAVGFGGRVAAGQVTLNYCADQCPIPTGLLPDAKKPRLLHGTLIMKDSVSAQSPWGWGAVSASSDPLFPIELPARVLRAGPQGVGPGRAPAALHLPCTPARHAQEQEMAMRVYSHLKR